jgi:short subunit dehydrogenase-like uncharacterized protein
VGRVSEYTGRQTHRQDQNGQRLLTMQGALAVVEYLLANDAAGGAYTPAKLIGPDLFTRLPGSGPMQIA